MNVKMYECQGSVMFLMTPVAPSHWSPGAQLMNTGFSNNVRVLAFSSQCSVTSGIIMLFFLLILFKFPVLCSDKTPPLAVDMVSRDMF